MSNLMMPSRVLLYGRKMRGISIDVSVFDAGIGGAPGLGHNKFLRNQFVGSKDAESSCEDAESNDEPLLAMIYGFEYEAHYYDLMAPTIMLVHGEGMDQSRGRKVVAATAAAATAREATPGSVVTAAFAATDGAGAAGIAAATAAAVAAHGAAATAAREAAAFKDATVAEVVAAAVDAAEEASEVDKAAVNAAQAAEKSKVTPTEVAAAAITAAEKITTANGATPASVAAAAAEASAAGPYIGRVDEPFAGFADNVRIWPYDKADFSLRLDPCSGPLESILVAAELEDSEMMAESSGRHVSGRHVSGRHMSGRHMSGRHMSGRHMSGKKP